MNHLYAKVYGSTVDAGAFVIYASKAACDIRDASLVVQWNTGAASINVGLGWHVHDAVSGDTIV